jgi:ketosteroid isomerase-like protein
MPACPARPLGRDVRLNQNYKGAHQVNRYIVALGCLATVGLFTQVAIAGDDPKVTTEIMALARAQWDAEIQGKSAAEQSAWTADDYTEFNSDFPVRIDGKALNDRLYEAQMRGGGKTSPSLAKSTRVYAKLGGQWKLVHANFAPVTSPQD